jgi:hypothetical protein
MVGQGRASRRDVRSIGKSARLREETSADRGRGHARWLEGSDKPPPAQREWSTRILDVVLDPAMA